jgi:hypothetical protein
VIGLTADDHAKRDEAVILGAAIVGAVERHGDCRRDFQRTGHGHDVIGGIRRLERLGRALEQGVGHIVVKARFDDQDMRGLFFLGHKGPRGKFGRSCRHLSRVKPRTGGLFKSILEMPHPNNNERCVTARAFQINTFVLG